MTKKYGKRIKGEDILLGLMIMKLTMNIQRMTVNLMIANMMMKRNNIIELTVFHKLGSDDSNIQNKYFQ